MSNTRKRAKNILIALVLLIFIVSSLYPYLWNLMTSLKPTTEMANTSLLPHNYTLEHFKTFLSWQGVVPAFRNSVGISTLAAIIATTLALFAAYSIVRFRLFGKRVIFQAILGAQFIPLSALVLPFYLLAFKLALFDTWWALVLVYLVYTVPFATWLLAGFIQQIPGALEEAAMVDGCSRIGAIVRILLPLAMPGVFVTAVFVFIKAWQEYLAAAMLTQSFRAKTLPVVLVGLQGQTSFELGTMMAGVVVAGAPAMIAFLILHKHFLQGMGGGVKG